MKRALRLLLGIVAISILGFAPKPDAKKHYHLTLSTLFQAEDEWVYEIKIETREPTRF